MTITTVEVRSPFQCRGIAGFRQTLQRRDNDAIMAGGAMDEALTIGAVARKVRLLSRRKAK
jgi:hypothetical protein